MSKRRISNKHRIITLVLMLAFLMAAAYLIVTFQSGRPDALPAAPASGDLLYVQFIDVGQGDSTLITTSTGETMLIDAGESSSADAVFEELDERGIDDIDVLVATHPHSDHIGGMQSIMSRYDIGRVLMPDMTSDSKTYTELMETINNESIPLTEGYAGYRFSLGSALCTVVSPNASDDKDANNESIVIYLDFGDTDFLFTGDMEEWAEESVLEAHYYIDADVLKVAHHGSSTSTSDAFLSATTPEYAVISCGLGNSYGHPHDETLDRLGKTGAEIYRTDVQGDILFTSDGKTLIVKTGD